MTVDTYVVCGSAMRRVACALLLLYLPLGTHAAEARRTTVCELIDHPPATVVQWSLQATVLRDPRHGAFLVDPACRGKRIGLRFADGDLRGSDARRFETRLQAPPASMRLQVFNATLSGTYPPVASPAPRLFVVSEVERFESVDTSLVPR